MHSPITIRAANLDHKAAIVALLQAVDLLINDILAPTTRYWIAQDQYNQIVGTAGVELGQRAALLRSVAVTPRVRGQGLGRLLTEHALDVIRKAGYAHVYLFSTRSGAYWQQIGFRRVPLTEIAQMLPASPQVLRFQAIGKFARETAWRKDLLPAPHAIHDIQE